MRTQVGMEELIANSAEEFVQIAHQLAGHSPRSHHPVSPPTPINTKMCTLHTRAMQAATYGVHTCAHIVHTQATKVG